MLGKQQQFCRWLCLVLGLAAALLAAAAQSRFAAVCGQVRDDTVRLHIVAASDTVADQSLKLQVRDAVLRHAARLCRPARTQAQARQILAASLPQLGRTVQAVLTRAGRPMPVHLAMERTYFATAHYPGATLPAGTYDALRIVLGKGRGHNWWCCLYPELCLAAAGRYARQSENAIVTAGGYEVRFAVVEWWQKWFAENKESTPLPPGNHPARPGIHWA